MTANSSDGRKTILRIENLTKEFGSFTAINDVSLDIVDGEFFTIVGPSGSGKSTMLRILAGLERPTAGNVYIRDEVMNEVPANKRPTSMVFQSLALFNHKSVGENIEFSQKMRGVSRTARRERCVEMMNLVHLPESFINKPITQCSGGERQRVALARALASDPDILFFDEPLSAMDFRLRKLLEVEFKDLHRRAKKTFVYITHSLEEAMIMSDRIAILRAGEIVQVGTPDEIYTKPNSKFVSEFMGEINTLQIEKTKNGRFHCPQIGQDVKVSNVPDGFEAGYLIIRPESVRYLKRKTDAENQVKGTLYNEYALGSRVQYHVNTGDTTFIVERLREDAYQGNVDDEVSIGWDAADGILVTD
jgi:spermidine/putrescine transport system ATP-binding protein